MTPVAKHHAIQLVHLRHHCGLAVLPLLPTQRRQQQQPMGRMGVGYCLPFFAQGEGGLNEKNMGTGQSLRFNIKKIQLAREVFVTKKIMQWNYVREHDTRLFSSELGCHVP